jgi:hypothetical protein
VTYADGAATARIVPCTILRYCPTPVRDAAARANVLRDLERRSFGVRIGPDGLITPAR